MLGNALARFERESVGRYPLEGAHVGEIGMVVVAPAGWQEEMPLVELAAVDRHRLGKWTEELPQPKASVHTTMAPAIDHRAHVIAAVTVDENEPRPWKQAVQIVHTQGVDAGFFELPPRADALVEESKRGIAMLRS